MPYDATLLIPLIGGLLSVICLVAAQRQMRCYRLMQDLPTSKTSGVFIGLVELKGTAEAEAPLVSYLAEQRCVYYSWDIQERWSRTVTETYRDSDGRTKTRTRQESGWTTVADGSEAVPFYLRDDAGVIQILPKKARIEATQVFSQWSYPSDDLYYIKGPAEAVANSDHVRQFSECAIPLHAPLYVLGQAREREDIVAPEIAYDAYAPMFLISVNDEHRLVNHHRWSLAGLLLLGFVLCGGGFLIFDRLTNPQTVFGGGLLEAMAAYLIAAAVAWLWSVYNSLIGLRHRVRQGWSVVEVQLKRRQDLIPRLVQIVSSLSEHERDVHTTLAKMRSQLRATPPGTEGPDYEGVSSQLLALAEGYPQLTAQQFFLRLQDELTDTEHRIALARGHYNEIVSYWNTRLERVPDCFVAWLAGMHREKFLKARGFERENPRVALFK